MKIKRLYFNELCQEFTVPKISILLGARQVGKSTLLHDLEDEAKNKDYHVKFTDLEQSRDMLELSGSEHQVVEKLISSAGVTFIDEFHYLKNASKIFKAIYDRRTPIKIFASGSSSLEIHKHLKESLAGRYFKTIVYPLCLQELKQVQNFQEDQYLQWGGMPDLVHYASMEQRSKILDNILSTYITKDIKGLIQEENIRAFNSLLYLLAQSQGSVVVLSNLARETGLSEPTIARHLEIMAQTYVLHPVMSYSQNMANELKKSRKYYLFDIGIRNALLKDFRPAHERDDKGVLYETAVLLSLIRQLKPNMELRFWRTKKGEEVDFVLLKNRVPVPIEVKSKTNETVPQGLRLFLKNYPKAPFGIVYNEALECQIQVEGRTVFFRKWTEVDDLHYLKSVL